MLNVVARAVLFCHPAAAIDFVSPPKARAANTNKVASASSAAPAAAAAATPTAATSEDGAGATAGAASSTSQSAPSSQLFTGDYQRQIRGISSDRAMDFPNRNA